VGPLYLTLSLLGFNYNLAHTLEQPNKTANQSAASLMFLVPSPTAQLPPTMAGEVPPPPPPPPLAYMGLCFAENLFILGTCKKFLTA
jgi:hypothetical protein